jgi:peptide/nickel transport system substrate-binding protein
MFDEAAALVDRRARAEVYARLQKTLTDDVPYFWIVDSDGSRAYRSAFTGFRLWAGGFAETVHRAGGS